MKTAERRLVQLEGAMTPTERVKGWLAEAHSHDTFVAYARADHALGPDAHPLDRLARETREAAEAAHRGRPRDERDAAVRAAVLQTVFRFQLVLRTNTLTQDFLDREGLIQAALAGFFLLFTVDEPLDPRAPFRSRAEALVQLRALALARVAEIHALEEARRRVETRYVDGTPVLFPAAVRAWAEQRDQSEHLALAAIRHGELEGLEPPPTDDPDAVDVRVAQLVADHVEPALLKAHDEMGEGRRALAGATRWLRPMLGSSAPAER